MLPQLCSPATLNFVAAKQQHPVGTPAASANTLRKRSPAELSTSARWPVLASTSDAAVAPDAAPVDARMPLLLSQLGRYTVHPDTDLQKLHEMVQNWGLTHSQPTVSKAPKAVTGLDFDPFASDVNANPVTATGVNSAGAYIGSTWPTVPAELGATNFGGNAVPIVAAPAVAVATPSPAIATVPNAKPATPVAVAAVDVDTEAEAYNPGDYFVGARVPASRKGAKATGPSTTSATPAAAPAASAGDNGLAGSAFGAFAVSGSPAGVSTDAFTPSALSGSYPGAGFGGSAGLGGLGAMGTMGAGGAAGLGGLAGQGAGGLGSFGSMFGGFGGSSSLLGGASTSDSSSSSRPYPISFSGFGRRRRHM